MNKKIIISLFAVLVSLLSSAAYATPPIDALLVILPPEFMPKYGKQWDIIDKAIIETKVHTLIIKSYGFGGYVYMGIEYMKALEIFKTKNPHNKIVYMLYGMNASMHAFAACEADYWVFVDSNSKLLFHRVFQKSVFGKFYTSKGDAETGRMLTICQNKISSNVVLRVWENEDVILYKNDVIPGALLPINP